MNDSRLFRVSRVAQALADAGIKALALATIAGLVLERWRPGSAVHRHFMGSTGSTTIDSAIALLFAIAVLLPGPLLLRVLRVLVGATVATLSIVSLGLETRARFEGSLLTPALAPPATLVALMLVVPWTVAQARGRRAAKASLSPLLRATALFVASGLLVLAHIEAVGATDYRAKSDAILVLGAKVHADGTPSGSLLDRTRTACELWHEGWAPVLVLSGGRDRTSGVSEPEAMRRIALDAGVPDEALVLDETGADTAASVRFTARLARGRNWFRVLVVSNDYHLARVRLLADREGLLVRTVPARETAAKGWKAFAIPREVVAWAGAWAVGR